MSRLDNLMTHLGGRRLGHTTLMLYGLNYTRPAIMIFATNGHARMAFHEILHDTDGKHADFASMTINRVRFVTIAELHDNGGWKQWRGPAIIDHYALDALVREHTRQLIEKLRRERN